MKKVIIIDDIKDVLDRENSSFERNSIEVYPVPSNAEALLVHREVKADMIITYLDMPDMSGEDLCDAVRNDPACSKVSIIMVCPRTKKCQERSKNCRANAFFPTPVKAEDLLSKTNQLLHISDRANFRAPVGMKVMGTKKGDDNRPFLCFSENISSTGMMLGSDREFNNGERIICSFILENNEHMTTEAEIVRSMGKPKKGAPNRYGIKFKDMPESVSREIERYVQKFLISESVKD
jgi:DNA-binding response OmpR family regulator